MFIGLTYDIKEDYGYNTNDYLYSDFASPSTISYIKNALERNGHTVELIGNLNKLNEKIKIKNFKYDIIFNIAEGINSRNREGLIPALLELNSIPHTGSDAYALSLSLNKFHTKLIAEYLQIPTPKYIYIDETQNISLDSLQTELASKNITYPLIVKPINEGSSMGIIKVLNINQLFDAVNYNRQLYRQGVLCEKYIEGTELTVAILGNRNNAYVLGIAKICNEFNDNLDIYTTELKFYDNVEYTLAKLPKYLEDEISQYSLKIHNHFKCNDYNRIDFRLDKNNHPYFLEMNPLPALDMGGSFEVCGKERNLEYYEIIESIVNSAIARHEENSNK